MDNRQISIQAEGKSDFELAMQLISGRNTAIAYRVHENHLIFYWTKKESDKAVLLPFEMNVQQMTEFAWGWLSKNKPIGPAPDHDGDNEEGFKVFNEAWGHVFNEWQAFVAITPIWAMYGK